MNVYLIRHAESEDNVFETTSVGRLTHAAFNAWLQASPHSTLTTRGHEQAAALGARFRDIPLDRLYTSPWPRAHATANVLGSALGLTPTPHQELYEVLPPVRAGRGRDLSLRQHFARSYLRMCLPGARPESWAASVRRTRRVWAELTREPAEAIAVVSHGGVIGLLCLSLWRDPRWRVVSRDLRNCGVSLVVGLS